MNNDLPSAMPFPIRQLALWLALATAWTLPASAQEPIWHYSPYQIRVWLATTPSAELNAAAQSQILRTLEERAEAVALAPWTLHAEMAPAALRDSLLAGLEWMTVEQLAPGEKKTEPPSSSSSSSSAAPLSTNGSSAPSDSAGAVPALNGGDPAGAASPPPDFTELLQTHDKLILLRVAPERGGFTIEARELDCRTRQWSEVVARRVGHAGLIANEAFRAVEEVFRPLARIERVKGKAVTVRLRAGGLAQSEESPARLPDNPVLLPVVRFNDRYGLPRENGIQIAPWAFLTVQERQGEARVNCELVAGVGSSLGARGSSRTEKYALLAPARHEKTAMIVRARPLSPTEEEPPEPLSGYEVHERLPGAETLTYVGRTDWRGQVIIEKTDHPLRLLYVKNGNRVLARFPVAPGVSPRVEVNVMNDDRRLEVEGFASGLQSRILDLVVAREVLALQIRKRIEEKKLDEAAALMNDLRTLPSRDQVQAELNREEARQRMLPADRVTKSHIDKLFNDTRTLITKYLEPTLIQTLDAELRKAQAK